MRWVGYILTILSINNKMTTKTLTLSTTDNTVKEIAAGYHHLNNPVHTVAVTFSNWSGLLEIQATLALEPAESDWFTVLTFGNDSSDYDSTVSENLTGNFVWFRAIATTDSGEITEIQYNF